MSSHHVIRDEQEPPVFVLDRTQNVNLLKQLLGWSPFVWAFEPVAEWLMSLNIKIDGILSSEPHKHQKINQQSGDYRLEVIDEIHMIQSIFQVLGNKLYTGLNIFCNEEQKEQLVEDIEKEVNTLPITLITEYETTLVIKKHTFRKWYPANSEIVILRGELMKGGHLIREERNGRLIFKVNRDGILQINSEDSIIIIKEI